MPELPEVETVVRGLREPLVGRRIKHCWAKCYPVKIVVTRLPVEAITGNYDAFRSEGLSPDEAVTETLDCYPEAGADAIREILRYRTEHQLQAQP